MIKLKWKYKIGKVRIVNFEIKKWQNLDYKDSEC